MSATRSTLLLCGVLALAGCAALGGSTTTGSTDNTPTASCPAGDGGQAGPRCIYNCTCLNGGLCSFSERACATADVCEESGARCARVCGRSDLVAGHALASGCGGGSSSRAAGSSSTAASAGTSAAGSSSR